MKNENRSIQKDVSIAYERPLIIYDGIISTRAGSPIGGVTDNGTAGVDPANLFE